MGVVAAISLVLWLATTILDYQASTPPETFVQILNGVDPTTARYVLTGIAQSLSAVLGISMMVVLLVVQLAAARYSHSIIELCIEDRVNTVLLSLFVGSIVYTLWVANTIRDGFPPTLGSLVALVLASACFVSLIPYFRHVFGFLEPDLIVSRLEKRAIEATRSGFDAIEADRRVITRLDQIGRIATTSVSHLETDVAVGAVRALERVCCECLKEPAAPDAQIRSVQMEAFTLFDRIYGLALNKARDVAYQAASSARGIAQAAIGFGRDDVPTGALMLMNTMLREGINAKDSLTIYHLLHQYRLLAEVLLDSCDERIVEMLFYFKYYALSAQVAGIKYIVATAAYDLNILCQKAWACQSPLLNHVLESFLEMEPYFERNGYARSVFPIRKMYGVLASHFLSRGAGSLAEPFIGRLKALPEKDLARLREHLFAPIQPNFWEFTERKVNFDYLDEKQKECLRPFLDTEHASYPSADYADAKG